MIYLILELDYYSSDLDIWFKLTRLSDGYVYNGIDFVPCGEYKIGISEADCPGRYEYYAEEICVKDDLYAIEIYETYYINDYKYSDFEMIKEICKAEEGNLYMLKSLKYF